MFIVIKKKTLIIALVVIIAIVACAVFTAVGVKGSAQANINQKTVIIDAGHGGIDKGVVGLGGTAEAEKNLEIAFMLKERLEDAGFFVVMTRTGDDGAEETANFKQEDFARRKRTVEKYSPDALISIHCNKFPSADRRGIQAFYNPLSEQGKALGQKMQDALNELNSENVGRTFAALGGEYYMLNLTTAPSVIVECGFLSNPADEELLCDKEYLEKLTFALLDGVVGYFEENLPIK